MAECNRPKSESTVIGDSVLAEACNQLNEAIERQASKIVSFSRQRLAKQLGILTTDLTTRHTSPPHSKIPDIAEARERLRQSRMVPLGTSMTGEGKSIGYFWSVYPVEAKLGNQTVCFAIDEVAKPAGTDRYEARRLYDILVESDRAWVVHDGQTVEGEALQEPLQIVREACKLYV